MKLPASIAGILLFFALLCAPPAKAQDGLAGALSGSTKQASASTAFSQQLAAADFDQDQRPDGAVLVDAGIENGSRHFRIELHVTTGSDDAITFFSDETGLAISALDVNRDGAPDIVVERAFSRKRIQVYLNDGHGRFHRAKTEQYPAPNPVAPYWGPTLRQGPSVFCLPVSQRVDSASPRRNSIFNGRSSDKGKHWTEEIVPQSTPRAPFSSRGPPSLLCL